MSDLDARIRRLEDRAEIEDLVLRYFLAADDDDWETLGRTFAENGSFSAGAFPGGSDRESVVKFIQTDRQSMGVTVHTQNTTLITFTDDDHAGGVVGAHLELARGGTTVYGAVRYYDTYVRTSEGWRFGSREMAIIHVGPWDEVGTSLTAPNRARWPGTDPAPADLPRT
ncbi:nuclear transport factor 2 family protein [Pseudonocardia sp. KRD291]|uniref:nuclear transport factor 2 family protein n=1 Tax=Pseudonocardia sp. KRD291 TaxID=2792007 RepID=UPI001C49F17F|nr:nuclear transport factor 2 family protein [Pseudonocardia sp. KRD291]MBW0102045.1 nuclear transport factor 2 family protein [Pseudonocardia sp. KRD291]